MKYGYIALASLSLAAFAGNVFAVTTGTSYSAVMTSGQLCGPSGCSSAVYDYFDFKEAAGSHLASSADSGSTAYGRVTASAEADLQSGILRATATAIDVPYTSYTYAYVLSVARIGDSFSLYDISGIPYSSGGVSTLHVDISGVVNGFLSGGPRWVGGVYVQAFQPGGLAAWIANDWPTVSSLNLGLAGLEFNDIGNTTLPSSLDLSFATPLSGQFDWIVNLVFTANFLQNPSGSDFVDVDLGHTIRVSFDGPDGTHVVSASGFVPSPISAVPEPGTLSMIALGIGLTVFIRRRRFSPADHGFC